ncbi:DUF4817 domain-containing protein [Trichonephila clavipes]|uniref:DUF4817 domain-containing protein n=1 Tax=Trichonephila clavipes TaxID=2585209 RepID=A0A8X6VHL3_TRICX|nr:DUF4817 domain-containing protein [Trichonephila clavipes]
MPTYIHREMADMHLIYGMAKCNGREALRMYCAEYPGRQLPSRSFFATLHRRMCETGSFNVHKLDTGRQRTTRTVDAEDRVLQELERNPSTSTRVVARDTHIPQATVWRIAHDEGLYPYHLQRIQALELGDYNKHMDFARWFLHESNADRNFAASVLFTDEATFSLEEGLNGSVYLTFLQEVLPEMLNDVPMPIRQRIRFQHDGAPAHFSIDVRAHLQATFPGGWIGRGGPIAWPA